AHMVAAASEQNDKPFYLLSTRAGVFRRDQEAIARQAGVAFLSGVHEGLEAIRKLARWSRPPSEPRPISQAPADIALTRATIHESDAKDLLGRAGLTVTREKLVHTLDQARAALS